MKLGSQHLFAVLACGLITVGTIWYYQTLRPFAFDDAYISYRYAQNLAEGYGIVFNVGERVFGTSSPLTVLVLGVFGVFGFEVSALGGVLFTLSLAAAAALGFIGLHRWGASTSGIVFVAWLFLGLGNLAAFFGLETALYLALLLGSLHLARDERYFAAGLVAGLGVLTRYDGGIGALTLAALVAWQTRRFPMRYAIAGCSVVLPWLLFAWVYFGSILPNTLSAKAGTVTFLDYISQSLNLHLGHANPFADWDLLWLGDAEVAKLLALVLLLGGLFKGLPFAVKKDPYCLYPGVTGLLLWIGYGVIGPPTEHQWHTATAVVLVGLFCITCWAGYFAEKWERSVDRPTDSMPTPRNRTRHLTMGVAILIVGATLWSFPTAPLQRIQRYMDGDVYKSRVGAYLQMANWIKMHQLQELTVATSEPGYLSYHSRSPVLDRAGLVTKGLYVHGPTERLLSNNDVLTQFEPGLAILPPNAAPGSPLSSEGIDYVNFYNAFASRVMVMRRDLFESRLEQLSERFLAARGPEPYSLSGAWKIAAEDGAAGIREITRLGGNFPTLTKAVVGNRRRPVFSTPREVAPWFAIETPPFLVDFDQLEFLFQGTHKRLTAAQLVIDGQIVLQANGTGNNQKLGNFQNIVWPMNPFQGRVARLRFVDAAPAPDRLVVGGIQARNTEAEIWSDFEDDEATRKLWPELLPANTTTLREPALRNGLGMALLGKSATSFGTEDSFVVDSRSFELPKSISFYLYDGCSSGCKLELLLDDKDGIPLKVHTLQGRHALESLHWDLQSDEGTTGRIRISDENPTSKEGLLLDSVVFAVSGANKVDTEDD